mmetsp:Transcript_6920/g.25494  ORF Transcript_6920/g.25494 Transcript_6920/m.25494 type:complete len:446 (+) Transcript_6920:151-1488(+)
MSAAVPGPGGGRRLHVLRSVVASFGNLTTDPAYVFDIRRSPDGTALAATLSSNAVKLYSTDGALTLKAELLGHSRRISVFKFPLPQQEPSTCGSSSEDGTLRLWDLRTAQETAQFTAACAPHKREELHDMDLSATAAGGHLLVGASGEGRVLFWDRRKSAEPVRAFEECHGEAVTQAMFLPQRSDVLLTAAVDGLVCAFDVAHSLDDEEGLLQVINVGSSVAKIGVFGPEHDLLWCLTTTEELSLWDWEEYDRLADLSDTRGRIAHVCGVPADQLYCIGCRAEQGPLGPGVAATEALWLLAGTKDGNAMAMRVNAYHPDRLRYPYQLPPPPPQEVPCEQAGCGLDAPQVLFAGAHSSTIRAIELCGPSLADIARWPGVSIGAEPHGSCVAWSCGEDALIAEWSPSDPNGQASGWPAARREGGSAHSGFHARSGTTLPGRQRHAPY